MEQMPPPMKRSRLRPLILFSNAAGIVSPCGSARSECFQSLEGCLRGFARGRAYVFCAVRLSLSAAGDKNRVAKRRELFGEFVTDAPGAAGDQNRIALEFHN